MGIELGGWHYGRVFAGNNHDFAGRYDFDMDLLKIGGRIFGGIVVIFLWRAVMKPSLLRYLPPVYRFVDHWGLTLPRRYFLQSRDYKSVPPLRKDDNILPQAFEISAIMSRLRNPRKQASGQSNKPRREQVIPETFKERRVAWEEFEEARLAVSGGVDSMALASLCSENAQVINRQTPLVGFIVDHKLREGSTQEARNVAEELRRLRIEPRVLTLDWKHHGNPSTVEHLEHLARKLRFQAIGRACSEYGIESLLVAHHADDQAETVLMRIVGKYFGSGLRGIGCSRPIPECQGIYGVDQSGSPRLVKSREPETTNDAHEMLIEDGGVSVLRPLLSFTKEELTEYCKAAKVRWFEDRTNADPKFALRNTIRHLQKNDRLPVALRRKRLVAVAVRATKLEAEAESSAQDEYDRMGVSLD
ncbi:hypothetical protein B0A55_13176, partial [Friedmanniomyces simplex]